MSLWVALLECIVVYVFLNFLVIPRLKSAWIANRSIEKITKTGALAVLGSLRDVAVIASLVFGLFGFLCILLWLVPHGSLSALQWSVSAGAGLLELLQKSKKMLDRWFYLLPALLIAIIWWRRQHQVLRERLRNVADHQLEQLNDQRRQSPEAWSGLTPTPGMAKCDEQILALTAQLNALDVSSSVSRKTRQRLLRQIVALRDQREQLDYERRIQWSAFGDPETRKPMTRRRRVARILLSQGLFTDVKGFSKLLRRVSTSVLCLTLIGLAPHAGATRAITDRLVRLDEFRVRAIKQTTQGKWQTTAQAPADELSDDDQKAIAHLTDQFARALVRNAAWRPFTPAQTVSRSLRQLLVERAVLSETRVRNANGIDVPYEGEAPGAALASELVDEAGRPQTRLSEGLARHRSREIKGWFGQRWNSTRDAVLKHAALYHEPVRVHDLESALVDHFLSEGLDPLLSYEGSNEFIRAARSATSGGTKKAANEAVDLALRRMVMSMVDGQSLESALREVKAERAPFAAGSARDMNQGFSTARASVEPEFPDNAHIPGVPEAPGPRDRPEYSPGENPNHPEGGGGGGSGGGSSNGGERKKSGGPGFDELEGDLAASRPRGPKSPPPSPAAADIVDRIARGATENGAYSLPERAVESIAEYEDHFPASTRGANSTNLAKVVRTWQTTKDATYFRSLTSARIARARSFSMLRGFSRVGGVLIGREPDDPAGSADYKDIQWEPVGGKLRLTLVRRNGQRYTVGEYSKTLVHQALAYAADGRPVAATMTTAYPLPQLKIHLHPALVDSRLGCEITELDRFVDTFTYGTLPERESISTAYQRQADCYNFARDARIRAAATHVSTTDQEWLVAQTQDDSSPSVLESVDALLLQRAPLNGKQSIFARKPEFFSDELVKLTNRCAKDAIDHDGLAYLVMAHFNSDDLGDEVRVRELLVPAARFQVWSGVRERPFRVDPEGAFLRPPSDGSVKSHLWPFDFVIQVSFTSPPVRVRNPETYSDEHPLEFAEVENKIENQVWQGIVDNGLKPTLGELRDFVILQRLFRVALSERLGADFPMEKLRALARASAGNGEYFYTRRWNGSMRTRMSPDDLASIDPEQLERIQQLESAFGVVEDEQRSEEQGRCVPEYSNRRAPTGARAPR